MSESNDRIRGINIAGMCGTICGVFSLAAWAFMIVAGLMMSNSYTESHGDFADMNSLEKVIHAVKTICTGGVFGFIGLVVGGVCSFAAILLSSIGLAFEPKRVAVTGLVCGLVSVLAGITFLLLLVLTISRMNVA